MKAIVDKDTCIGCGICIDVCPEVFEMGADELAAVKVESVPPESKASCRDAAEQCPVSAITVEENP